MTQRNPLNERYTSDKQLGKTRKSAASAKPVTERASMVHDPAPKTKKEKKAEQKERERRRAERRGVVSGPNGPNVYEVPTDEYKMWRRRWWIALIIGIAFAVPGFFFRQLGWPEWSIFVSLGLSWTALIIALWIDLGKMRKIRKRYNSGVIDGNTKAARAQQKARAAELREQRKEAEAAAKLAAEEAAANPQPERKGVGGFIDRFKNTKSR